MATGRASAVSRPCSRSSRPLAIRHPPGSFRISVKAFTERIIGLRTGVEKVSGFGTQGSRPTERCQVAICQTGCSEPPVRLRIDRSLLRIDMDIRSVKRML